MPALAPVVYGKVTGRFISFDADGTDTDLFPDANVLVGTVTFKPSPNSVKVPTAQPDPATAWPSAITVSLDASGYLSQASGVRLVWLVATDDPSLNPNGFTYQVTANLRTQSGAPVAFTPFSISVPAFDQAANGGAGNAVDLTQVAPVAASNGVAMVQGPPGPAPILITRNTTTTTDPAQAKVTYVPVPNTPGSYYVDTVLVSGTGGGGGGSGTVTKVNGVAPDAGGNVTLSPANLGAATATDVQTAQTTASNALTNANAAQSTANQAQSTASAAQAALSSKADTAALASYAPLASPALTGTPTAPTPAGTDSSTKLATTAFVKGQVAGIGQAGNYGMVDVAWDATTQTWSGLTSRPTAKIVRLNSTNDPAATRPSWMAVGDQWVQHPDAVTG